MSPRRNERHSPAGQQREALEDQLTRIQRDIATYDAWMKEIGWPRWQDLYWHSEAVRSSPWL